MSYWFYENWTAEDKAIIHVGSCGYCNDGKGCHKNPQGEAHGKWHGPFATLNEAAIAAEATGKPVRKHNCTKHKGIQKVTDKEPALLEAIEMILADPAKIMEETKRLITQFRQKYGNDKSEDELFEMISDKIISNYSYYTAFVGGASALTGVVPGLGTVIAAFGGATADVTLSMKYQIEMIMAIAVVYGHDITIEEEKRLCLIIAGLGAINKAAKEGGKSIGTKAFIKMTQQYLKGATLQAVKQLFKKIGITFTRKAVEKTIPFGVGVLIGFSANKGLTWYVGSRARDFFKVY